MSCCCYGFCAFYVCVDWLLCGCCAWWRGVVDDGDKLTPSQQARLEFILSRQQKKE